jgi:hypothetical protein
MAKIFIATGIYLIISGLVAIVSLSDKPVMYVALGLIVALGVLILLFDETLADIIGQDAPTINLCSIAWIGSYEVTVLSYWLTEENINLFYAGVIPPALAVIAFLVFSLIEAISNRPVVPAPQESEHQWY